MPLVGISFHCGSGCYDATAFVIALQLARQAFDVAASLGLQLTLVDMGGGFPGLDGSEDVTDDEAEDTGDCEKEDVRRAEPPVATVFGNRATSGSFESMSSPLQGAVAIRKTRLRKLTHHDLTLEEVSAMVSPVLDGLFPLPVPGSGFPHIDIIAEPGRYSRTCLF